MQRKFILLMVVLVVSLLAALPAFAQDELPNTINIGGNDTLGEFFVASNGMTLYTFKRDGLGVSNCVDACATNWPPYVVESADGLTVAEGIPGEIGTIERADGELQVTYNDMPLYFWVNDAATGDATGHNFRQVWSVVNGATVYVKGNADLGSFLVGPNGFTLYMFTNDEAGVSNCVDGCAVNWPPLVVESADDIVAGFNLPGTLSTIERADGELQVTYNDMPLYFWLNDAVRGDATGENVNEVWFTIAPETVTLSSNEELGDFLVAPNGFTLYIFANDEAGVSNCVDACAENWPPFITTANERLVAGAGIEGELGTTERADGSLQVTYNGMPLYFWVNDKAVGDTTGHNVNNVWSVVAP